LFTPPSLELFEALYIISRLTGLLNRYALTPVGAMNIVYQKRL
jgi:hypothetical protein